MPAWAYRGYFFGFLFLFPCCNNLGKTLIRLGHASMDQPSVVSVCAAGAFRGLRV